MPESYRAMAEVATASSITEPAIRAHFSSQAGTPPGRPSL
eukprot:CAMPEP_0114495598 /NCGR_PEP_ID=MMETSP0109-20121206/5299_1 /TAXON_ID=29199 /ORGANISM="Chlorarachnion reptans, Strain CCCM449" /LENGTH=39 /DNA_ID= /DNA_START= /DNA_END= /DNA_ORIENTATION=